MSKKETAKPTRKPTPRSRHFLAHYERFGAGLSLIQYCGRYGWRRSTVHEWCSKIAGFREQYNAIREKHKKVGTDPTSKKARKARPHEEGYLQSKWTSVPDWAKKFLIRYSDSYDRVFSVKGVGKKLSDIEELAKLNERFRDEYNRIQKEIRVAVEDKLIVNAVDGQNPAIKQFLEANDARYRKKIAHEHTGLIQFSATKVQDGEKKWADRFGKSAEPGQVEEAKKPEVIDVEVIEEGAEKSLALIDD